MTVTAKALSASGDSAYANMVLTYDAGILEFVSCNATYGGGGDVYKRQDLYDRTYGRWCGDHRNFPGCFCDVI